MADCTLCGSAAVVQWAKRPTAAELASAASLVTERHAERVLLADPQLAPPVSPALPTATDTTVPVYACVNHAITLDGASLIHASTCTAPNVANLPHCDCTPEPPIASVPSTPDPVAVLPPGW
jgi:hypothetical protein